MIPNEELRKKLSVNIIMVVDRNWSVFPCKQVSFLRYNRLNIEKFKRMNTIALKRITAFSSLGVAVLVSKYFLLSVRSHFKLK